jgi:hypothetical protein
MKKLKWYFKRGTEEYTIIYEDADFVLVKNDNTDKYSFGVKKDFGTLWGFPVDQSCLTASEAKAVLQRFVDIDKRYISEIPDIANQNIDRWNGMIQSIAD